MRLAVDLDPVTARLLDELVGRGDSVEQVLTRLIHRQHADAHARPEIVSAMRAARAEYLAITGHLPEWTP